MQLSYGKKACRGVSLVTSFVVVRVLGDVLQHITLLLL
jgi:hypothetical protein